jgi:hypothetical protein
MISDANKKQILDSFLKNVACISDQNYQERVWVRAEGPECDDIDDTVCDFFDESYVLEKYKEFEITDNQHQLLMTLNDKLRKFADKFKIYSPEKSTAQLIQLPQWQEIREISKNTLRSFKFNGN